MSTLASLLPQPKHQLARPDNASISTISNKNALATTKQIPSYGNRQGFIPRSIHDFGDGGAFPEIHVAQYPLDMGRKKAATSKVVSLTTDSKGNIKYDAIVTQGNKDKTLGSGGKIVYSKYQDIIERNPDPRALERPSEEEEFETTSKTRAALEKIITGKIAAARPSKHAEKSSDARYVRYTPMNQGSSKHNSGARQRVIKMVDVAIDPLEPPKFRHKKVPRGPPSPPPPVVHSPPRKLTAEDHAAWKIVPCISNYKNIKGYTIPLDKRLAADGRSQQNIQINNKFAEFSEAMYIVERKARADVEARARLTEAQLRRKKEEQEKLLQQLAIDAKNEKERIEQSDDSGDEALQERQAVRQERRRERERERRQAHMGKNAKKRLRDDEDRDIAERVALGLAAPTNQSQYDQRLFNQSSGLDSGFGSEDSYNVYDKALFKGSAANQLYKHRQTAENEAFTEEDIDNLKSSDRFKADKNNSKKSAASSSRSGPVAFEKDDFGIDEFLQDVKKGGKSSLDVIGSRGHMHAAAGSNRDRDSNSSSSSSSSKRKMQFESSSSSKRSKRR